MKLALVFGGALVVMGVPSAAPEPEAGIVSALTLGIPAAVTGIKAIHRARMRRKRRNEAKKRGGDEDESIVSQVLEHITDDEDEDEGDEEEEEEENEESSPSKTLEDEPAPVPVVTQIIIQQPVQSPAPYSNQLPVFPSSSAANHFGSLFHLAMTLVLIL